MRPLVPLLLAAALGAPLGASTAASNQLQGLGCPRPTAPLLRRGRIFRPAAAAAAEAKRRGQLLRRRATTAEAATEEGVAGGEEAKGEGRVLLIDHLNFNHEKGRHDLLKAFYFDVLGLSPDPRKAENLEKGKKTLWANAGIHQFHLPEAPRAQTLDGSITLAYPGLDEVTKRLEEAPAVLRDSKFSWARVARGEGAGDIDRQQLAVTDPWGTWFYLTSDAQAEDPRGKQKGEASLALAATDFTFHVPRGANLAGISRFYQKVLGFTVRKESTLEVVLEASPLQTLTFREVHEAREAADDGRVQHEELGEDEEGRPINNGAHLSLYVSDLRAAYREAERLGVVFVNHRFKRRAYSLDESVQQCMFRLLDIVDPLDLEGKPIIRLEHEVRSVVNADGTKYKSCPFYDIPEGL